VQSNPLWLLGNPPRDKQTWERFLGVSLIKTSEGTFSITLIHTLSGILARALLLRSTPVSTQVSLTHVLHNSTSHFLVEEERSPYSPVIKKTKLRGLSPQANYTDRLSDHRLSAKLVPTLADRGCRVVSATIPPQSLISVF
jgi:hypothetical protein